MHNNLSQDLENLNHPTLNKDFIKDSDWSLNSKRFNLILQTRQFFAILDQIYFEG